MNRAIKHDQAETPNKLSHRAIMQRTLYESVLLTFVVALLFLAGCKKVDDLDGDYTLSTVHADTLMGVADDSGTGSPEHNDKVIQYVKTTTTTDNKVWTLHPLEDGDYVILSKQSGKALTVEGGSTQAGALLRQDELIYSDAQKFRIVQALTSASSKYVIINKGSGKALSVVGGSRENGARIEQRGYGLQASQQWVVSAFDRALPPRVLVTAEEAWDVFKEAGQPYVGPTYQQDFTQHNIKPASQLDPRRVVPGTMIPGRVTVEGKPFVEYYPGTLPYIAVCIHNKTAITTYMRQHYPKGWRECNGACDSLATAIAFRDGEIGAAVGDSGSGELCQRTVAYLEKITGKRPHMIVSNWPKGLLDMNRSPRDTVIHVTPPLRQHPDLIATWDDFMSFVREARDIAYQQWGGGLQIGFHGQVSRSARNHIGTGVVSSTVDVSKDVLNDPSSRQHLTVMRSSRLKYSLLQRKLSPWDAYKGPYSLGQGVAARGIPTFPSATMLEQSGPFFSTGGAFEDTSVAKHFQDKKIEGRPYPDHHPDHFDTVQLESYSNFMRGDRLDAYAAQLGEAIYDNLVHNLGFDIPRIRGGDGAMTAEELQPILTAAANCKGNPIQSTTQGRVDSHFHLPQACLNFCRETVGCKYVSMFVDPSPDPDNRIYSKTRQCHAYASCELETVSDYNVYRLAQ